MRAAIAAFLLCALPAGAAAQDVMVMGIGGDAPADAARAAREAVALALQQDGLRLLPEADLAMRVPPSRLAECQASACAWAVARELGVSMVAAVTTWATDGRPSSLTVSLIVGEDRTYTATEEVRDGNLLAAGRAAVTAAQTARGRALIIEGSSAPDTDVETPEVAEVEGADPGTTTTSPLHAERPLEQWILPSILGVVGLGLVGLGVYAMLDQQCDQRGGSGVCLRGTDPNYGLGATMTVLGGLSLVGAIVWIIVGGTPASQGAIDVVVLDGRPVGVRF